ncbi:hypothetical protein [Pleomorphomonas sp. PLEO]|uniref:hypothetical protein n=1 Tax=Pleomorphomonas sp. PLEO TaxID=3239306 RepID=UPI00351ECF61
MTMWSEMNTHFPVLANDFLGNGRGLLHSRTGNPRVSVYLSACNNEIYAVWFLLIEQSIKNML